MVSSNFALGDSKIIPLHYNESVDYYTTFLNSKFNVYSCCLWEGCNTTEEAEIQKADLFAELLELKKADKVFDFGCGFGGTASILTERYHSDITGFELRPHWVEFARKSYKARYECKDLYDTVGPVDKIYSDGMLVHQPREKIYGKCFQLLPPGGIMVHKELYATGNWSEKDCRELNLTFDNTGAYTKMEHDLKILEALGFENTVVERDITNYTLTTNNWLRMMLKHKEKLVELVGWAKLEKDHNMLMAMHKKYTERLFTVLFVKSVKK